MHSGTIDQHGTQLCNFYPHVESLEDVQDIEENLISSYVQIQLGFEDGKSSTQTMQITELDRAQWLGMDKRCWFNPEVSKTKISRYLEKIVRSQLDSAPRKKIYQANGPGIFIIEGEPVFYTGFEVIRSPVSAAPHEIIMQQRGKKNLDIDTGLSEGEAVSGMFDLISLSSAPGRVILIYQILCLMRAAYVEAGKRPNFCIYLYGKTGTKKTTFSSFLTQVYDRGKGIASPPRLNASIPAAVEMMSDIAEDAIIFDDLYPAESNRIRKQQEETLVEITRIIGDGTVPARLRGKKVTFDSPKCGVIFTGEYVIGSGSDAARLLPIEMLPPDGERLKYFQDHPLLVSTFYYFFIRWFIANYKEIVELLKEWLCNYRKIDLGVHARLQETHFFMISAFAILMQYCVEKNFLSHVDAIRLHGSFRNLITELVRQQDRQVQQSGSGSLKVQDYWGSMRELYKSGQLSVASCIDQFDVEVHDGLLHKNRLYFRRDKLLRYFPGSAIEDLVNALDAQGVLEKGEKNRTKQLSGLNGMRFYVIPLDHF